MAALTRTFRSLHVRNYRLYFFAQIVSMSGVWMQSIAQGWLVYDLTDSAVWLGTVVALQFGPVLLVGPWGGLLADRADKRKLLLVTQVLATVLATILGVLVLADVVELWMVLVLAVLYGSVNAVDNPARQSFVIEMVGSDDLANAVGLNSVIVNGSRIVGPALAGILFYTVGLAAPFLVNAVSYLFVIGALLAMRTDELRPAPPVAREPGQLRAGFRYVWNTPQLLLPLAIMAVVGTLGYNFSVILPLMAKVAFGRGAETYSALTTAMGIGALAGGLVAASRRRPTRRLLIGATVAFGVSSMIVAYAPTLDSALALLVPMGAFSVLFVATTNSLLQLNSDPAMRGRVMSLWAVVFLGSTPIGSPLTGLVASAWGPRFALAAGGAITVLAGLGAFAALRARARRAERARPAPEAPEQVAAATEAPSGRDGRHIHTGLPDEPDESEVFDDLLEEPARRAAARGEVT